MNNTQVIKEKLMVVFLILSLCLPLSCSNDETNSQNYYKSALDYYHIGKFKEAEIELRNAIQQDPNNEAAYIKLSEIYRQLKKPKNEIQALIDAISINPDNMEAQFRLAQVFILGRQTKNARETIQQILDKTPDDTKALHLLATAQVQERNVDAAIKTLNYAIKIQQDNPHLYMLLGFLLYYDKKDLEQSEQAYVKAISLDNSLDEPFEELLTIYSERKLFKKAENLLIEFTKTPNNQIQKINRLANFYESQNQLQKAEKYFKLAMGKSGQNDYKPIYNLGIFYARTNQFSQAVEYFKKALALNNSTDIRLDLARVYFNLKSYKDADSNASKILERIPNHPGARLLKTELLIVNRDYASALQQLEELIAIDKTNVSAHYLRAVCLVEKNLEKLPAQEIRMAASGDFSSEIWKRNLAIKSLKDAIELSPDHISSRLLLSHLYIQNNEFHLADNQLTFIFEIDPDNIVALYMFGDLKISQKNWKIAEKTFHRIIDLSSNASPAYVKLGTIFVSRNEDSKAIEAFKSALELEPLNMNALRNIISAFMRAKQKTESIKLLNAHLEHPKLTQREKGYIHYLFGKIELSENSFDAAKHFFKKSVQIYEKTTPSYEALAVMSEKENNNFMAIKYYEQILSYDPEYIPAYISLSRIYQIENKIDLAKTYLTKVLEINDNLPNAANDLAYLLAEEGQDLQKALHLASIAESQDPDNFNYLDTLGWVYYKQNSYDLAIYKFQQSLKFNSNNPYAHLHLGWAYYDTGRYEKAREHMKIALNLNPNIKDAEKVKRILGE